MRLNACVVFVSFVALFALSTAAAAPDDANPPNRVTGPITKDLAKKPDYGFCNAPGNAHKYPTSPVKIAVGKCSKDLSQTYTATSDTPTMGMHGCGGFGVSFGPKGNLNGNLHQITMTAAWGDTPLTAQQCPTAKVAAQAWGERCLDEPCIKTDWIEIEGGPKQRSGIWDAATQTCKLETIFHSQNVRFKTLNIDIIPTRIVNGTPERKRAKGTIRAELDGDCSNSAEAKPLIKK